MHWIFTMCNLFLKNKKGSQIFRHVLNYGTPVMVNYDIDRWKKKSRTNNICESEIINGYRGMQTKIFSRQLLDFKSWLSLGKTQFAKTLAKCTHENISQGCKVCLSKGDFQYDDLSHRLITCPTSNTIVEYIISCLTKQV